MKDKVIQLTLDDFKGISTDVAAELCAGLGNHELAMFTMFSALLLAGIAKRLFEDEELTIEGGEQ